MPYYQKIHCPYCDNTKIIKSGKSGTDAQRYLCQNVDCETQTFMLDYQYKTCEAAEKVRIPPSYQQQINQPVYHVEKRCRYSSLLGVRLTRYKLFVLNNPVFKRWV